MCLTVWPLDFATGDTIDTLRISGMVFEAQTLEPAQGMLVGVYSNLEDSAIHTLPMDRITKTNQLGQFTIRNLKEGTYRIFALNDVNRDYHWDRSEDVAFYDATISPTATPTTVTDTLVRENGQRDSLVTRDATRYLPDDVLLTWFNEGYSSQYLKDYKRPERNKITFQFGTKADTLPIIRLLNTHRAGDEISTWSMLDASPTLDTLTYWIADTSLVAIDSITLEASYMRTDTNDCLSWTTDTLRFNIRTVKKKEEKKKKKKRRRGGGLNTQDTTYGPARIVRLQPGAQPRTRHHRRHSDSELRHHGCETRDAGRHAMVSHRAAAFSPSRLAQAHDLHRPL